MIPYDRKLTDRILEYYQAYYQGLGLDHCEDRSITRLREDEWELERIRRLEAQLSIRMSEYLDHLIVGLGTGGLAVALKEMGVRNVCGIEPYVPALEIACMKAVLLRLPQNAFQEATAEHLPYPDKSFDFIHCFSVLEHVQNVRLAVREMYRVLNTGGILYIHTPNYAWPYEGHYKVPAPVFLPCGRLMARIWLKFLGRPTTYLKSVQLYSERRLNKILKQEVELYFRIYSRASVLRFLSKREGFATKLVTALYKFFDRHLDVSPYQEIIIKKPC